MEKKKFIRAITKKENGRLLAIASTENKDRVGDSLKAVDWDLKHFLNNPVLQAGHDYRPQYTIGIAENIKVVDNQLTFTPKFHNITQLATEIAKMYDEGYLTAWSVGFIPKEQNIETQKNQLLEISAVAVPANPYALTSVAKSFERELVDADKNEFIIREIKNWLRKDINITITNSDNESEIKDPGASEPAVTAPVNQPENADGVTLQVRTGQSNGHTHIATINSKTGDGITNNVNSHFHLVKNFKVQMGGSPTEQHDHTLEIDPSKISKELKDLGCE
jgi:hypothetical protein